MDKVKSCLQEKSEWYERLLNTTQAMKLHDDPTTTTSQIKSQQVVRLLKFRSASSLKRLHNSTTKHASLSNFVGARKHMQTDSVQAKTEAES